ncbi:MAG: porin family protein [Marinoscillum sp.]
MTRLILPFLLIYFSHFISAQNSPFGLKAGMNISTIGGDSENVSPKTGIHGGFFSSLSLSENFKLKPELVLSNQGCKDSENNKLRFSYWYLNAPLMIRYQEGSPGFLDFGIQLGTVIHANTRENGEKRNVTGGLENFDISLCAGVGFDLSESTAFEARYIGGLTNTSKNPEVEGETFPNRVFQFTIAYVLFK